MATLHVLRVFTDAAGDHGNQLGVFLDGTEVAADRRQAVASELGFAETVFVDDRSRGEARIFTPAIELPFAGHPTVGTAWLLRREGEQPATLHVPAGELAVRRDGELTFIAADPAWSPPFEFPQLESPMGVERLDGPPRGSAGWCYAWAWEDEKSGKVRARSFVAEAGIAEDEATGAAALALGAELGRAIEVRQGKGSLLHVNPAGSGRFEVGGRVALDTVREHPLG